MRERIATILAVLLALGILAWAMGRHRPEEPEEPNDTVWRMLEAARNRDLETYFSSFGGELEVRLRSLAEEMGKESFARYLEGSAAELKGVALFDVLTSGEDAQLTVEMVYESETEQQVIDLRRQRKSWKIVAAGSGTRRRSLIPYGKPIEEVD